MSVCWLRLRAFSITFFCTTTIYFLEFVRVHVLSGCQITRTRQDVYLHGSCCFKQNRKQKQRTWRTWALAVNTVVFCKSFLRKLDWWTLLFWFPVYGYHISTNCIQILQYFFLRVVVHNIHIVLAFLVLHVYTCHRKDVLALLSPSQKNLWLVSSFLCSTWSQDRVL